MLDSKFYGLLAMKVMSAQFTAEEWHHAISSWNCSFPLFSLILTRKLGPAYITLHAKTQTVRRILFLMLPGYQVEHSANWIQYSLVDTKISKNTNHFLSHLYVHPGYIQRNTQLP